MLRMRWTKSLAGFDRALCYGEKEKEEEKGKLDYLIVLCISLHPMTTAIMSLQSEKRMLGDAWNQRAIGEIHGGNELA